MDQAWKNISWFIVSFTSGFDSLRLKTFSHHREGIYTSFKLVCALFLLETYSEGPGSNPLRDIIIFFFLFFTLFFFFTCVVHIASNIMW